MSEWDAIDGGKSPAILSDIAIIVKDLLARAEAAEARADKAERERDEATTLINYIYYQECDVPNGKIWLKDTIDRWRANKEG